MKMNMLKQFNEKRRIGITASALLAGGGLILVLISLMLLYLWYPAILQNSFADANSLGALFPAVYFGIPLIISANVLGHIRLAVAISRRTGITFSLLLAQGSLLLMLLGLLILWHPIITASSGVITTAKRLKQWVMPWTNPRSDFGNQSCIARLAVGKAPASPKPKAKRIAQKDVAPDPKAVAAVIKDQNGTIARSTRSGPKKSASQPPGT